MSLSNLIMHRIALLNTHPLLLYCVVFLRRLAFIFTICIFDEQLYHFLRFRSDNIRLLRMLGFPTIFTSIHKFCRYYFLGWIFLKSVLSLLDIICKYIMTYPFFFSDTPMGNLSSPTDIAGNLQKIFSMEF